MSLTSYRAAPPRDVSVCVWVHKRQRPLDGAFVDLWIVMGFVRAGFNAWRRPTLPTLER